MGKYSQDQDDAYNDILEAGILATITRVSSDYDEVEGVEVITDVQSDTAPVMTFPASAQMLAPYDSAFIEDYKKGKNLFFYAAAKGMNFTPEPGDLLVFNSKVWEIEGSTGLNPDGTTPIFYTMGVKSSNLDALPVVL